MVSAEYVHIFVQSSANGFGTTPFWVGNNSDGLDDKVKEAAKTVLIVRKL
jgi:hypothetical protein